MDKEAKEELAGAVLRAYAEKQAEKRRGRGFGRAGTGVSPFFCVRTSPEPYGARAGQRLPAQRLKPQGAEKEKMPVKKKLDGSVCVDGTPCAFLRRRHLLRRETWRA